MTNTIAEAVREARETARALDEHPNSGTHIKARTMALVRLVMAYEEAGHVNGAQTLAAGELGCDRQLINRHVRRALARGWASHLVTSGRRRLFVTPEFSDVVEMETIDPTVTMWPADATGETPPDTPPTLPPFSLPEPYAY